MKKVLYLLICCSFVFGKCKKTPPPDPTPTPTPAPTMNYIKFTINGKGYVNKTFTFTKAKHIIQDYTYSETTGGVIGAFLDMLNGDTLVQLRFDEKTTGNKPFYSGAVFVVLTNLSAVSPLTATTTSGSFQVKTFTPTQIVVNGTSGTKKGKFAIDATFSGEMTEDSSLEKYTLTNGEVKFDGE